MRLTRSGGDNHVFERLIGSSGATALWRGKLDLAKLIAFWRGYSYFDESSLVPARLNLSLDHCIGLWYFLWKKIYNLQDPLQNFFDESFL